MDITIKLLGIGLVMVGVGFPTWRVAGEKKKTNQTSHRGAIAVGCLSVFAGLALILADRITVLTLRGVGTIQAVTAQAIIDAGTVTDIRKQVEQIKNQVETGRDTVDLVASEAKKAKELSEVVETQSKDAAKKLEILNFGIVKANQALQELQNEAKFQSLVLAAENDDLHSFNDLMVISKNSNDTLAKNARQAINAIAVNDLSGLDLGYNVPWNPGIVPDKISSRDLIRVYFSSIGNTDVISRLALLQYISNRKNLTQEEKIDFWLRVADNEISIKICAYALKLFYRETKANIPVLDVQGTKDWWNKVGPTFSGP